ncbi:hypothetical protein V8G54_001828 [Vigna mungo]|uniref:CBS domain-containing protein n=1 Tax=Vigna mungo TaxID=3915 RepID=A0AAQ3SC67_VIGMU
MLGVEVGLRETEMMIAAMDSEGDEFFCLEDLVKMMEGGEDGRKETKREGWIKAGIDGFSPLRSFSPPSLFPQCHYPIRSSAVLKRRRSSHSSGFRLASSPTVNSVPRENGTYTVADFMTKKQDLHVVKTTTTVDEALEALVNNRISGLPVIDGNWNLVGVVSDYDLLAIDSISGTMDIKDAELENQYWNLIVVLNFVNKFSACCCQDFANHYAWLLGGPQSDANLFPNVDSSWKTFNELQKLLSKTNGQVVGDLMTPTPLVVHESTSLEEAARLLLETKYRRLPVVDDDGKLVGYLFSCKINFCASSTEEILLRQLCYQNARESGEKNVIGIALLAGCAGEIVWATNKIERSDLSITFIRLSTLFRALIITSMKTHPLY